MAIAGTSFKLIPAAQTTLQIAAEGIPVLSIPWREANAVQPEELQRYIRMLERVCAERPQNADGRTCLGLAHAMNDDMGRSMQALEEARRIDPRNFFAQLKCAELHYRHGALERADNETCRAAELARAPGELSLARTQLAEIRRLRWEGAQKPALTKPLIVALISMTILMTVLMTIFGGLRFAWK